MAKKAHQATILQFPRKRGRPRLNRPKQDMGTEELQAKRNGRETIEPLDLCLERSIITPEQHWCGIHLRWLYTLRYGAPGVRAIDPAHPGGIENKSDDPEWRELREQEYHEAMQLLNIKGHARTLSNICIHNEQPMFLKSPQKNLKKNAAEAQLLIEGLDILVAHWRRSPRQN